MEVCEPYLYRVGQQLSQLVKEHNLVCEIVPFLVSLRYCGDQAKAIGCMVENASPAAKVHSLGHFQPIFEFHGTKPNIWHKT
jgi:hypothetical protein